MRLLKRLQNRHFAAGVEHGRIIGIQSIEAFIHSEIRVLKANSDRGNDIEQRISELTYVLTKIRGMYVR
jgi:hypothetical protein